MIIPIKNALISVYDKNGIVEMGRTLAGAGVTIYSTGGTARDLRAGHVPVTDVAEYTQFPEMLGGRVKSLHPKVHGGILFKRDAEADLVDVEEHGLVSIDLVVCNFYPASLAITETYDIDAVMEQTDIGGPAMVRAAAKNHKYVGVVTDAADYGRIAELVVTGGLGDQTRRELAQQAFATTGAYDLDLAVFMARKNEEER